MYKDTQRNNFKYKIQLIKRATKEELIFKQYLDDNNIRYMFQKGFLKPFHRIVDFYLPQYRLIIEIDGGYHNDTKDKDNIKDRIWKRFRTLRILNSDVNNGNYIDIFNNIIRT